MFLGKRSVAVVLVVILSLSVMLPVYAANDRLYGDEVIIDDVSDDEFFWAKVDDVWVCTDAFGEPVTGWAKKDGSQCFLNKNGEMRTGWIKYQGKWYYLYTEEDVKDRNIDKSLIGTLAKDTWIDNYYVDEDGVQKKIKK